MSSRPRHSARRLLARRPTVSRLAASQPERPHSHRPCALLLAIFLAPGPAPAVAETGGRNDLPTGSADRTVEAAYHFARAKLLADEGAYEEALAAYETALDLDGSDPYSRVEVAKFHSFMAQIARTADQRLEHLTSAAGFAGEARRLAPDNVEILRNFAQIHLRLGEHQLAAMGEAQEAFEALRERTEGDLQVLTSLGQIYLWRQEGEKAVDVLQEAARYLPSHRMIQTMLLEALLETDRRPEAEGVLEKLIEIEPDSLDYRLRLAELRSERGDHRAAASGLAAAPKDLEDNPRLRRVLARELHLSGGNQEALALTDALKQELPYGPGLRRLRVAILSSLTRYDEAIEELLPALEAEGDAGRSLQDTLLLSRLLERVGRPNEAAELLRKRLDEPDPTLLLKAKLALCGVLERHDRHAEAAEILRAELKSAAEPEAPMLGRALSDLLARMGRGAEALAVLDDAIARLGESAGEVALSLELRRAAMLLAEEEFSSATREAAKLAAGSSGEIAAAARILQADALAGLGRVDEALELLGSPSSEIDARRQLAKRAEILLEHNRDAEASRLLEEVLTRGEPNDLFLAAQVYQRTERYSLSIPLLERLLRHQDDSRQTLFLLGAAHERTGARDRAVETFQRLLELAPDHAPTLNYLGYMWAELGENLDEAVELILRAVALDPDNGAYVDSLGWAYFQLGRYQEARGHLEWAARLIPDDATIFEHLGDLYVVLKDLDRARASYRQALDLGGEDLDGLRRKLETLDQKDL